MPEIMETEPAWIACGDHSRFDRCWPEMVFHQHVVSETIRARRIAHLLNLAHQIVHEVRGGRVRVRLAGQPVQRVVDILNRLVLAVGLRG